MSVKNLKYILLFIVSTFSINISFWYTPNCTTTPVQSQWWSGWCFVYSNDNNWYCSTEIWLNLYLNNLDSWTRALYDSKRQPQANRFSKLLSKYNESHPDDIIGGAGTDWLNQVSNLNYLMGAYWLSHSDGCKQWNTTLNTYFTANLCGKIFEWSEVSETNATSCENGWEWDTYCCIKSESCSNPATPQTETWTCWSWFQNNWLWCCISICTWNTIMPEWWTSASDCTWCIEGETVPNADHTKCICDSSVKCCWIKLNTVVPFIWDCIELDTDSSRSDTISVNSVTAFPILMQWLMKIVMSVIMVFSFIMLIVAWLMMTAWAFKNTSFDKWKTILKNVIISLILLWCSWLILSLINPSFFGG